MPVCTFVYRTRSKGCAQQLLPLCHFVRSFLGSRKGILYVPFKEAESASRISFSNEAHFLLTSSASMVEVHSSRPYRACIYLLDNFDLDRGAFDLCDAPRHATDLRRNVLLPVSYRALSYHALSYHALITTRLATTPLTCVGTSCSPSFSMDSINLSNVYNIVRDMYGITHLVNKTTPYKRESGQKIGNIHTPKAVAYHTITLL